LRVRGNEESRVVHCHKTEHCKLWRQHVVFSQPSVSIPQERRGMPRPSLKTGPRSDSYQQTLVIALRKIVVWDLGLQSQYVIACWVSRRMHRRDCFAATDQPATGRAPLADSGAHRLPLSSTSGLPSSSSSPQICREL
jgi:hypothetical protein